MLFVNTKRFAERLVSNLERHGFKIGALTGDIPQPRRLKILQDFKSGVLPLLVATDVASRGLHIDGVTHVINVDLPQDPEDYVHRIGRTARAGQAGKAISLADEDYVFSLDAIQRLIGMKIPVEFADDKLFAAAPAKATPPAKAAASAKVASPAKAAAPAPPATARATHVIVPPPPPPAPVPVPEATPAPRAAAPPPAPERAALAAPSSPVFSSFEESSTEESPEPPVLPADFWTREAFGLEVPQGGFGDEPPEPPPPPAEPGGAPKRRRRRRGRRVAGRVEAGAPA
jgi:Helicase conserved C-terminal domain